MIAGCIGEMWYCIHYLSHILSLLLWFYSSLTKFTVLTTVDSPFSKSTADSKGIVS